MNENKKRITFSLSILGTIALTLVILGVSYAYFTTRVVNPIGSSINVNMMDFGKITFEDGNEIVLADIYPGTYEDKIFTIEKTGSNSSDMVVSYIIKLVVRVNTLTAVADGEFIYSINGYTTGDGILVNVDNAIVPESTSQLGGTGTIREGEIHTYTFNIGINETGSDQNSTRGEGFNGYLQVINEDAYSHGDL